MHKIQTCGSHDATDDMFSLSIADTKIAVTFDGLDREDLENIADLCHLLLYQKDSPVTWHSHFEPNDSY